MLTNAQIKKYFLAAADLLEARPEQFDFYAVTDPTNFDLENGVACTFDWPLILAAADGIVLEEPREGWFASDADTHQFLNLGFSYWRKSSELIAAVKAGYYYHDSAESAAKILRHLATGYEA